MDQQGFQFNVGSNQQQSPLSSSVPNSGECFTFTSSVDNKPPPVDTLIDGGVKLGTYLFKTSDSLFNYIHNVLINTKIGQDVRYDECIILLDLLKKGHERAAEKLGCGISSIKVVYHPTHRRSKCFMLQRKDGTKEDFSYIKCACKVFNIEPKPFGGFKRRFGNHNNGGFNKKIKEEEAEYTMNAIDDQGEDTLCEVDNKEGENKTIDPFSDNVGSTFGGYD